MDLSAGTVLLGKYRVDEVLGTGGMGRVVRASHMYLQQPVAIKILLPQMAESAETVSRFLREAQATVRLRSEHIARVMDVGTMSNGTPFMVMEFLEGNDLNQILRHHGPQLPPVVCDLMLQACEGMAEAHAIGIVHRDIKPSNFFITRRPDGSMLLKILDFGISKTPVGVTELTNSGAVIGTPTYMAPEQMRSGRNADARSDIWSMGIVMYQLLAGRPPFIGEAYEELVLKVNTDAPPPLPVPAPAGLVELIMRCLSKDPKQRPQNVGELARYLAPFASDPMSASQSAGRATRILQNRTSQQGMQALPLTAGGGLATPIPISPAQMTPRNYFPPAPTSLSQGSGQVTQRTRGSRVWMIAGVATILIVAGFGGYFASLALKSGSSSAATRRDEPYLEAPPPRAEEPKPAVAATGSDAPKPEVKHDPPPAPPPEPPPAKDDEPLAPVTAESLAELMGIDPNAKADPAPAPPAPPPVVTKPTVATRPVSTQVKKPETKVVKPKKHKDEDLFNSRH